MKAPDFRRTLVGLASLLLLLATGCRSIAPEDLKPFTTDGCTAFPEGPPKDGDCWAHCCLAHDLAYWRGGTYRERIAADEELRSCVAATGHPRFAGTMRQVVRTGGSPYFPTSFRWGYGWPYPRGYRALTPEEENRVRELSPVQDGDR